MKRKIKVNNNKLKPIIKCVDVGGRVLATEAKNRPNTYSRYIEPFLCGGAVWLSERTSKPFLVNVVNSDLLCFYECVKRQDKKFFGIVDVILNNWKVLEEFIQLVRDGIVLLYTNKDFYSDKKFVLDNYTKLLRNDGDKFLGVEDASLELEQLILEFRKNLEEKMDFIEKTLRNRVRVDDKSLVNFYEVALKSSYYNVLKSIFNERRLDRDSISAIFWFMCEFSRASVFGGDTKEKLVAPFGGISYINKNIYAKAENLRQQKLIYHLENTEFQSKDFEEFFDSCDLNSDDYIFIDFCDKEVFSREGVIFEQTDQERLAEYLIKKIPSKWLVITKENDVIHKLYVDKFSGGEEITIDEYSSDCCGTDMGLLVIKNYIN